MQLPYFFEENIPESGNLFLGEMSSRHIVQVLRMKETEEINVTNGKGLLITCSIINANKKKIEIAIKTRALFSRLYPKISIAISLIKNANRFEWFLEKATEIGVSEIIPLICSRTEKSSMKMERMRNIIVSAVLQSRQTWMPEFKEPVNLIHVLTEKSNQQKFIAHCDDPKKKSLKDLNATRAPQLILIGPEGDFTPDEIKAAIQNNFLPVTLGETRLRTETAGIVAAILLMNKN
ncbi:MAG: RsmE family RNA methyltransferase [Ginsengibacter sp.]